MAFEAELDDVRQEVRRGYASNVIVWWPKRPGLGNVVVTGTPTYSIEDPAGTSIVSGSCTVTSGGLIATTGVTVASNVATATVAADHGVSEGQVISTTGLTTDASSVAVTSVTSTTIVYPLTTGDGALADGVGSIVTADKLSVAVDASSTTTYALDTDYSWIITWTFGGVAYVDTVRFDSVLEPFTPRVSLNDFVSEVADSEQRLDRQATRVASGRSAAQHASVLGVLAWADVRQRLRAKASQEDVRLPMAIVDREPIQRVVVAAAIAIMYRAEGGGLESEHRDNYELWRDLADTRFASMGPIKVSTNDNRVADDVIDSFGSVSCRRSQ